LDCTGKPDGEYPDPLNKCSATFYVCSNGVTYKQICPPDLFFELNIKVCADFLDVFDCAGKTRPPTTYRPTTLGPILAEGEYKLILIRLMRCSTVVYFQCLSIVL